MRLATFTLYALFATNTFAQQMVTVKVVDKDSKKAIDKANVVVVGTNYGTITNALGFFKLPIEPGKNKLSISHVMYRTEVITVPDNLPTFIVPLEKMVYPLPDINLRLYPNSFSAKDIRPKPGDTNPRPDSMVVVESLATFPFEGGIQTFADLFGNAFQYPEAELIKGTGNSIVFGFTIDENGDYKNVGCITQTTSPLCPEFERIISQMPKWTPGEQRGEPVQLSFQMIITYGMNDHWKAKAKQIRKRKN